MRFASPPGKTWAVLLVALALDKGRYAPISLRHHCAHSAPVYLSVRSACTRWMDWMSRRRHAALHPGVLGGAGGTVRRDALTSEEWWENERGRLLSRA